MPTAIWWIRRDLRLHDNPALSLAAQAGSVIPLFIIDPKLLRSQYLASRRLAFLFAGLRELGQSIARRGGRLIVKTGQPEQVLQEIVRESGAQLILAAAEVSPFGLSRDARISAELPLHLLPGITIRPPGEILKTDGEPYTVFTPYRRKWLAAGDPGRVLSAPERMRTPDGIVGEELPNEPAYLDAADFPAGETAALARLDAFARRPEAPIFAYGAGRDRLAGDGTARLSPYLRFGMLSPRAAALAAQEAMAAAGRDLAYSGAEIWLSQLIWRDFFFSILHHFPHVRRGSFRREYDRLRWRNDPAEFDAWANGRTGYPVVDAGMRQLLQSGWMHNRARMITASFLVKDLLIDWRWGERWFMQHLLDGDPASNNGGWQWVAGTGTDAAPYFRIFNPVLQGKRFDPQGEYIKRWVPELRPLEPDEIHEPWRLSAGRQSQLGLRIGETYPEPLIDHARARQRTIEAYKKAAGR